MEKNDRILLSLFCSHYELMALDIKTEQKSDIMCLQVKDQQS